MSMRLAQTAFSFFLMLLPVAAGAIDLNLSAEGVTGYDDNIYRTSRDETDDLIFRLTPTVGFSSEESKMGWSLVYRPTYEIFAQHTDANELTHDLRGEFDYILNDKTAMSLTNRYRRLEVLNFPLDDGVDDESNVVPDNDIRREKIDINDGSFGLNHAFSPKWSGQTNASYRLFYTSRKNSNDSKAFTGSQSFQYALNAANDVGLGASITAQMYDEFEFQPASNTFFYNIFGTWVRRFGERTTLSIRGGPTIINTDQDDIAPPTAATEFPHAMVQPGGESASDLRKKYEFLVGQLDTATDTINPLPAVVPGGSVLVPDAADCGNSFNAMADRCQARYVVLASDPDAASIQGDLVPLTLVGSSSGTDDYKITFFGEVEIKQRWTPNLFSSLAYNRRDATASAQGSGSVADMVTFLTSWRPSERWDLSVRGTWLRRQSATEISQAILGAVDPLVNPNRYVQLLDTNNLAYYGVNRAIDTERWAVHARAARRVTRRTTMTLRLSYANQETRHSDRNPDTFENFMALFGVRYDFDPIRF
jgi:hypothetical protein